MTQNKIIDLRSDTVTKPTKAMRKAIANAEVGDDMYGEDPTVLELEEEIANLLGKEKALFLPTGSMANQIAIKAQTQPGDDIFVGQNAHNWMFESGATGFISSVQITVLPGDGRYDANAVRTHYKPDNVNFAPTTLISIENTHNVSGGVTWDRKEVQKVLEAADELDLSKHLDGARLWNASTYYNVPLDELTKGFDTVSVCLSKGLGAPVGSLLAGNEQVMKKAYRLRRILGGSMRQAGIMAAGGLYAIRNHREKIQDDHENAQLLALGLNKIDGFSVDIIKTQTNMVILDITDPNVSTQQLVAEAKKEGLLFLSLSDKRIRLVTHLDVSREDCIRALDILSKISNKALVYS
ncbi:low-specificity L-threonine aldolase [Xanthovirga aplysinae]|uniref:low-specificity L-threonine aldolase n=1 Tax=Xanthovirga aplysinae TaxID=2529853 RepID=UPI0012BD7D8C|nr:low-specificity L-threonine aldolase [Xanthovirga aplysinae]MTI30033.1 low-specificity L-threonine aldolase [Xanthovirga aplysinae]